MLPAVDAGFAVVVVVVETVVVVTSVLGVITSSELLVLVRSTGEAVNICVTGDPRVPVEMEIKKTF